MKAISSQPSHEGHLLKAIAICPGTSNLILSGFLKLTAISFAPTEGPKNVHEFSNTHRTLSSGDHDAVPYHPNDNEIDDDDDDHEGGESGSGQT